MNIVDQITERLITRRRRIGAEGKDGLRLPVRHGVAATVCKLSRRIGRALRAVIAPGRVTRADDPDIPLLRVHVRRRSAERITDVILEAAVCGKLFGVDRDLLRTAGNRNVHTQLLSMALHPVRHAHELVFSGFVRFVRFFVLLRGDDERHMVIALAADEKGPTHTHCRRPSRHTDKACSLRRRSALQTEIRPE